MLKKILTLFVLYFVLFISSVSSASISVDEIFTDIDGDYKYLDELQTLYDRGMVSPDENWEFNRTALLTREEFVGISEEASCNKCIKPTTALKYLEIYNEAPFSDIEDDNKYFYCISHAKETEDFVSYNTSDTCDDWTVPEWENSFCANNYIKKEEALAFIMRTSWILTAEEAELSEENFNSSIWDFPDLASDLKATNDDGTFYNFYPYFERALDYTLREYDADWNEIISNLLEKEEDYLRPNQYISKEDFLQIAYIVFKSSDCIELEYSDLSIVINIYDKICDESVSICEKSDLDNEENKYDFEAEVGGACELGIDDSQYIWRFYNSSTWEEIKKYWQYVDNYQFLSDWKWYVFLRVIDKCWWTGEVFITYFINWDNEDDGLSINISWDSFVWKWPLIVDFEGIVSWWEWPYVYEWDFWDWEIWIGEDISHVYMEEGVYNAILTVSDSNWLVSISTVLVKTTETIDCDESIDTDGDWVNDCEDKCILIAWSAENSWCPIFEPLVDWENWWNDWWASWTWYDSWLWTWDSSWASTWAYPNCLDMDSKNWVIEANAICTSCPCPNYFDYSSNLRACDLIFPAITSRDGGTIYSKWSFYEIK